jgi:hypothetical protein
LCTFSAQLDGFDPIRRADECAQITDSDFNRSLNFAARCATMLGISASLETVPDRRKAEITNHGEGVRP